MLISPLPKASYLWGGGGIQCLGSGSWMEEVAKGRRKDKENPLFQECWARVSEGGALKQIIQIPPLAQEAGGCGGATFHFELV